ncbi:hypothetical protein MLD52_22605 [Puniceicoccaceae bacterium K14]|nr:hypothetical protein [Puniceicoccaceae bacterium K14]
MKISAKFILPTMILISLVGCCSLFGVKKKSLYYDYEESKIETALGAFYVSFTPEAKLDVLDEKEVVVWAEPYMFNTQFYTEESLFRTGVIINLKIESVETGKIVCEEERIDDVNTIRRGGPPDGLKKFLAFGVEIAEMDHNDYRVVFDYIVYEDDETVFEKGAVDVVVKAKNSRKG